MKLVIICSLLLFCFFSVNLVKEAPVHQPGGGTPPKLELFQQ